MWRLFSGFTRLRVRLAAIVAVALAPVGVLAFVQALNGLQANEDRREAELQAIAQVAVDAERARVAKIRVALAGAAQRLRAEPGLLRACEGFFEQLSAEHEWMTRGVLVDPQGEIVCGSDRPGNVSGEAHWRRFLERRSFVISGARISDVSGRRIFGAYYPVSDPRGTVAAIAVGVDLAAFRMISDPPLGQPVFALLDSEGVTMLAEAPEPAGPAPAPGGRPGEPVGAPGALARGPDAERWLPEDRADLLVYGDRAVNDVGADGIARAYFTSALETGQLWAVTSRVTPTLADLATSPEGSALLVPVALWVVAVAVAYFAIDILVSRHIDRLRAAAFRIGRGDLETPVGEFADAPRELRALGHSIRAMATRIGEREQRLQQTLEIQRRLLLEVHHRVKNNLQMISSLMNIETRRARDPDTLATLRLIQDRIHALALVHQNLYEAESVERIALDRLVGDVCRHLETSLGPRSAAGRIVASLEEIVVDTLVATPVALFLSEAVSNAYKHADAEAPGIRVELQRIEEGFTLSVSNRTRGGARRARARAAEGPGGLGMKLMGGFARQLGGRLLVENVEDVHRVALRAPNAARPGLFAIRGGARA